MLHIRAAERLETHGQSPLHKQMPKSANALGNIQHSLNPELRPLLKQWARDLSLLTSRQIAKQISNHCNQQQIVDSAGQIVRKWANEGPNPFPIALGLVDDNLSLFNLKPTNGETQDCLDSIPHRLLLGAMSIILYCDHTIALKSVCVIYFQLKDHPEHPIGLGCSDTRKQAPSGPMPFLRGYLHLRHTENGGDSQLFQKFPGPDLL